MRKGSKYNVAVVGVGAVGIQMLRCLKRRKFPLGELRVFARSARDIEVDGQIYSVKAISLEGFEGIDIALFAGTEGEKGAAVTFASEAIRRGAVVIDNGADFRMKKNVPLVIPEVNAGDIKKHKGIIANPNCSTIQMVVATYPIYKKFGIKRMVISSYQAASGAGRQAVAQLFGELRTIMKKFGSGRTEFGMDIKASSCVRDSALKALPRQLAFNVFPHIGNFQEAGYTTEEWKTIRETRKILHDNRIKISATCVRVPVRTGHSQAIYLETNKRADALKVKQILSRAKGVKVVDEPQRGIYPVPLDCEGRDEVFVGRIRNDRFINNGLWLWVVSDNLLKGAALNAIQIAEFLTLKS